MGTFVVGRFGRLPRRTSAPWWSFLDASARSIMEVYDPVIDGLDPDARLRLARQWDSRAGAVLTAAVVSTLPAEHVLALDLGAELTEVATRVVWDGLHEATVCHDVATRHRGVEARAEFVVDASTVPVRPLDPFLMLMAVCGVDAIMVSACIVDALHDARSWIVTRALDEMLGARVSHAQARWLVLERIASDRAQRERVLDWLPSLVRWGLDRLASETPDVPLDLMAGTGVLSRARRLVVARRSIEDVLLPSMASVANGIERAHLEMRVRAELER